MIVVDTSVWIDHARRSIPALSSMLDIREAHIHEFVVGELLLGSPGDRRTYERSLDKVPRVATATPLFVRTLIEEDHLHGTGIGYVDAHLVASTLLIEGGRLWTRDKRLGTVAGRLGIRADVE